MTETKLLNIAKKDLCCDFIDLLLKEQTHSGQITTMKELYKQAMRAMGLQRMENYNYTYTVNVFLVSCKI
jgi:hypothetical protein